MRSIALVGGLGVALLLIASSADAQTGRRLELDPNDPPTVAQPAPPDVTGGGQNRPFMARPTPQPTDTILPDEVSRTPHRIDAGEAPRGGRGRRNTGNRNQQTRNNRSNRRGGERSQNQPEEGLDIETPTPGLKPKQMKRAQAELAKVEKKAANLRRKLGQSD